MERGLEDPSSEYADEGTAAHLLGSTCLDTGKNPEDFRGRKIFVGSRAEDEWDGAVFQPAPEEFDGSPDGPTWFALIKTRRIFIVDDAMIDAISTYVDNVRKYAAGADVLMPEQRISIEHLTGEEDAHGTSDATVLFLKDRELQSHDLKYGMGVAVSARENKQLMIYALGLCEEYEIVYGRFEKIRLIIHQPRLGVLDEWSCTRDELEAFAKEVERASVKALRFYRNVEAGESIEEPELNPSEDACRWCKAKASCPALEKLVMDTAAEAFEVDVPGALAKLPADVLSAKMQKVPLLEDYGKAVRAELERRMLVEGEQVPLFKIVMGRQGAREWQDPEAAVAEMKEMRLTYEERFDLKPKSPTQMEKFFKENPRKWARLEKFVAPRRPGKPSVAPESDKRPAYTPPDPANEFEVTTEEVQA
jgi:hypothetical protein